MNRRRFLSAAAVLAAGGAGCLDSARSPRKDPESPLGVTLVEKPVELPMSGEIPINLPDENLLFVDSESLERRVALARDGREPWAAALLEVVSLAEQRLVDGPVPYRGDRWSAAEARDAARHLALAAVLTGEDRYAAGATDQLYTFFLDEGTRYPPTSPVIPHARIINSITIPGLLFAAQLMSGHPAWDEQPIGEAGVRDWARTHLETTDAYSQESHGSAEVFYEDPQNRQEYGLAYRMCLARFGEDDEAFEDVVRTFKRFHNGEIHFEGGGVQKSVYPDGQRVDRSRGEEGDPWSRKGWAYSLFGLDASITCAQLATDMGHDLYTWQDEPVDPHEAMEGTYDTPLIERQLDRHAQFFAEPDSWDHLGEVRPDLESGRGVTAFKYGYLAFQKQSYLDVIERYGRPYHARLNTGHVTLTHADIETHT